MDAPLRRLVRLGVLALVCYFAIATASAFLLYTASVSKPAAASAGE